MSLTALNHLLDWWKKTPTEEEAPQEETHSKETRDSAWATTKAVFTYALLIFARFREGRHCQNSTSLVMGGTFALLPRFVTGADVIRVGAREDLGTHPQGFDLNNEAWLRSNKTLLWHASEKEGEILVESFDEMFRLTGNKRTIFTNSEIPGGVTWRYPTLSQVGGKLALAVEPRRNGEGYTANRLVKVVDPSLLSSAIRGINFSPITSKNLYYYQPIGKQIGQTFVVSWIADFSIGDQLIGTLPRSGDGSTPHVTLLDSQFNTMGWKVSWGEKPFNGVMPKGPQMYSEAPFIVEGKGNAVVLSIYMELDYSKPSPLAFTQCSLRAVIGDVATGIVYGAGGVGKLVDNTAPPSILETETSVRLSQPKGLPAGDYVLASVMREGVGVKLILLNPSLSAGVTKIVGSGVTLSGSNFGNYDLNETPAGKKILVVERPDGIYGIEVIVNTSTKKVSLVGSLTPLAVNAGDPPRLQQLVPIPGVEALDLAYVQRTTKSFVRLTLEEVTVVPMQPRTTLAATPKAAPPTPKQQPPKPTTRAPSQPAAAQTSSIVAGSNAPSSSVKSSVSQVLPMNTQASQVGLPPHSIRTDASGVVIQPQSGAIHSQDLSLSQGVSPTNFAPMLPQEEINEKNTQEGTSIGVIVGAVAAFVGVLTSCIGLILVYLRKLKKEKNVSDEEKAHPNDRVENVSHTYEQPSDPFGQSQTYGQLNLKPNNQYVQPNEPLDPERQYSKPGAPAQIYGESPKDAHGVPQYDSAVQQADTHYISTDQPFSHNGNVYDKVELDDEPKFV